MVYPVSRSMNADLAEGMTDGTYKKVIQNRGGKVEGSTAQSRASLDDNWYGIHEKQIKTSPDGLSHPTPNYVATPPVPGDVY